MKASRFSLSILFNKFFSVLLINSLSFESSSVVIKEEPKTSQLKGSCCIIPLFELFTIIISEFVSKSIPIMAFWGTKVLIFA